MDKRLFNAACTGDVDALHQLLKEDPFVLGDSAMITLYENPLNIATKAGQLNFVQEIIKLIPGLAKEINQDGLRPLDIASAYGYVQIVKALVAASDPNICRLPGRDGRTALHYATINGRVDIIDELLAASSEAVKDVTAFGETVLHLAVKYYKFDAFRCLLDWLEKTDMRNLLNWKDKEGNSVLHCAVSRKQLETIELMFNKNSPASDIIEVNAVNKKGLTAIDLLDILIESSSDALIRKILQHAGGQGAPDVHVVSEIQPSEAVATGKQSEHAQVSDQKPEFWSWMHEYQFKRGRDPPSAAQNALLVIAALIVTVTFEAGINPPSYLSEATNPSQSNSTSSGTSNLNSTFLATQVPLTVFLVANTIAFSTACSIIDYVRGGLPFQRELRVSGLAMMLAYEWSLGNAKPTGTVKVICLVLAFTVPLLIRLLPDIVRYTRHRKGNSIAPEEASSFYYRIKECINKSFS